MSTAVAGSITLETALALPPLGTIVVNKSGAVVCMCTPGTQYKPGWGPRASEWRAHQARKVHQDWARAQRGKRKLELPLKREASGEKQETPLGAGRGALGAERENST